MKGCFPYEESKKDCKSCCCVCASDIFFCGNYLRKCCRGWFRTDCICRQYLRDKVGDGVMLHAFNWSYNTIKENLPAIAAAGYTTVQTSPVQQPKDYSTSGDVTGQWWKLYQPISFHIAEESWLGTKDDLKSLCDEADKYGIKIICDIVSNHIANADEARPETVSNQG